MQIVANGDNLHYQNLFSGKNKKNISICWQLKILPRVLSIHTGLIKNVSFLTLSIMGNISADNILKYLSYFFPEKRHISWKNKKQFKLSSAELAQRVVKINKKI